jgi:hypothetical protein
MLLGVVLKTKPIFTALFCFSLLVMTFDKVSAESENWVEVVTFSEERPRFGATESFTINHEEWRILWEYEIDETNLTAFFFDVKNNDTHQLVGNYSNSGKLEITQGINNITGHTGNFYLDMGSNGLSYSITVEQNVDSVPEFGSWVVVPVALGVSLFVVAYKKRGHQ